MIGIFYAEGLQSYIIVTTECRGAGTNTKNMNYPVRITLRKINTLEDAVIPQREKYPDGTERHGLMWEFSKPHVGLPFIVLAGKLKPTFVTSDVTEILEDMDHRILFKTYNSMYELLITEIPED